MSSARGDRQPSLHVFSGLVGAGLRGVRDDPWRVSLPQEEGASVPGGRGEESARGHAQILRQVLCGEQVLLLHGTYTQMLSLLVCQGICQTGSTSFFTSGCACFLSGRACQSWCDWFIVFVATGQGPFQQAGHYRAWVCRCGGSQLLQVYQLEPSGERHRRPSLQT